jgi:DNA-directed RNA polymerase specialized sigma24 family protein
MVDAEQERQFRELVQARWTSLVRYAYLLTGDRGEAEDAVQAALERTLRHWTRIGDDRPEAYIRAAVTNGVISRRRWRSRRPAEAPLADGAWAEGRRRVGDGAPS